MSGPLLVFIELSLVFLAVLAWGFHELRSYRRYKREHVRKGLPPQSRDEPASRSKAPPPSAGTASKGPG